ncbi:hypothetical protein AB3N58_01935 [Leptospira sp. WS60.C2]
MDKDIIIPLITGLFGFSGTILSAFIANRVLKEKREIEKSNSLILKLCEQIEAYYSLSEHCLAKLEDISKSSKQTLKIKIRNEIEAKIGLRPTMTASDAKVIKERISKNLSL